MKYRFDDGRPDEYTDAKIGCVLAVVAFVFLSVVAMGLVLTLASQARGDERTDQAHLFAQLRADCLAEHNSARRQADRGPLFADERLDQAAQQHAEYCARRGRLSHYGPGRNTWADRARAAGYHADLMSCSENIAYGYDDAADVTGGWLRSRGHRQNVLGNWRHVGFGCARAKNGRLYWCAVYALPRSVVTPRWPRLLLPRL